MLRRSPSALGLKLTQCVPTKRKDGVLIRSSEGHAAELCTEWLIDNDVKHRHATGQKLGGIFNMEQYWRGFPLLEKAECDEAAGVLRCRFSDGYESSVRLYDIDNYFINRQGFKQPTYLHKADDVARVPFEVFDAAKDNKALFFHALERIWREGMIVVEGCPLECSAVIDIARAVDAELRTLYGSEFKVASKAVAGQPTNNVAYTREFLDLHQDIVYLESMPGIQLLMCERFDADVTGGESMFLDAFLAAEELRRSNLDAFTVLTEVPAAFMKDDMHRANPAQYYYAVPHIQCNDVGDVIKVVWAPAFEAPMPPSPRMREYYAAKRAFTEVVERLRGTSLVEFRMKPGECAVFHNCRMLHGRRHFVEPAPERRLLHGCYIEGDAFKNKVVALGRELGLPVPQVAFGNRSWR